MLKSLSNSKTTFVTVNRDGIVSTVDASNNSKTTFVTVNLVIVNKNI